MSHFRFFRVNAFEIDYPLSHTMSIVSRSYHSGDENKILDLFKRVFGLDRDLKEWNWRFHQNPLSQMMTRVAENAAGALVAQYTVIQIRLVIENQVKTAALSLDTMVAPECQGQGLFTRLASELFESPACAKVGYVVGLPNEKSYRGLTGRLKFHHVGDLPLLIRPLDFVATIRKYKGRNLPAPINWMLRAGQPFFEMIHPLPKRDGKEFAEVRPLTDFDSSFEALFNSHLKRTNTSCAVHKDATYMNWRYRDAHHMNYRIFQRMGDSGPRGILVISLNSNRGVIVDLIAADNETESLLAGFALAEFKKAEMAYALIWCFPHQNLFRTVKRLGFLKAKAVPFCIRELHEKNAKALDVRSWHFLPGDNDTF